MKMSKRAEAKAERRNQKGECCMKQYANPMIFQTNSVIGQTKIVVYILKNDVLKTSAGMV